LIHLKIKWYDLFKGHVKQNSKIFKIYFYFDVYKILNEHFLKYLEILELTILLPLTFKQVRSLNHLKLSDLICLKVISNITARSTKSTFCCNTFKILNECLWKYYDIPGPIIWFILPSKRSNHSIISKSSDYGLFKDHVKQNNQTHKIHFCRDSYKILNGCLWKYYDILNQLFCFLWHLRRLNHLISISKSIEFNSCTFIAIFLLNLSLLQLVVDLDIVI
jgi:hypothetical protein